MTGEQAEVIKIRSSLGIPLSRIGSVSTSVNRPLLRCSRFSARTLCALSFFFVVGISANANAFDYDIAAHCREVAAVAGGSYAIERTCTETERRDRSWVRAQNVERRIANHCNEVAASIGGSYGILRTCIETEREARGSLRR